MMRIAHILNATEEQIKSGQFNIFIGISLGNKYFSKENIKEYISWALKNTNKGVLVLIADSIHAINYQVLNKYNHIRAMSVSLRRGQELESAINKIIKALPAADKGRVHVCRWDEVRKSSYYKNKIKIFKKEFATNKEFHDVIIDIVADNLGTKAKGLNSKELNMLALYVLDELPIILNGVDYKGENYNLHPYPGLGALDDLLMGLQNGDLFPELAGRLHIENQIAVVEAYVD